MCLRCKTILNNTNRWNYREAVRMHVPCGKCPECIATNQNSWLVRCYYEWINTHGRTYFYTLTMNESMINRYSGLRTFFKDDCQRFIATLRRDLEKALGERCILKYIICSEYGENTRRPHYHCLLFVNDGFRINPSDFYRFVQSAWSRPIGERGKAERVSLGFVNYGHNYGVLNNVAGIRYVTKYVCKDMDYAENEGKSLVFRFLYNSAHELEFVRLKALWNQIINDDIADHEIKEWYLRKRRELNSMLPFHLQSTRLGINALDVLTEFDKLNETLPMRLSDGRIVNMAMPRYFIRKLWYDVLPNDTDGKMNRFVLNEEGVRHKIDKMAIDIKEEVKKLDAVRYMSISDQTMKLLGSMGHFFGNEYEVAHFVRNIDLDLEVLAIYKKVFRGRVCPTRTLIAEYNPSYVKREWREIAYQSLTKTIDAPICRLKDMSFVQRDMLDNCLYDLHPFFQPYEFVAQVLECVNIANRTIEAEKRQADYRAAKRIKQYYLNTHSVN